jgi:hypothetical protein
MSNRQISKCPRLELTRPAAALGFAAFLALSGTGAHAQAPAPYAAMAPLEQYLMSDRAKEIAQARGAAPASVSSDAEVLVLTRTGYVSAAPGKNGFVCMVQRSWFSGLEDGEFWNPKERSPICFNRQAAHSVLPMFLKRTQWVLAGLSRAQIIARTHAAIAAGQIRAPAAGAITFMMAKDAYLSDQVGGGWHPHVMFFTPRMSTADWGANLPGSPVMGAAAGADPYAVFYVPVPAWSDGTPDARRKM